MTSLAPLDFSKQSVPTTTNFQLAGECSQQPDHPEPASEGISTNGVNYPKVDVTSRPRPVTRQSELSKLLEHNPQQPSTTDPCKDALPAVSDETRSRSSSLVLTPPGPGNGFVFGAGEVGNVSSPRFSASVRTPQAFSPRSVEARFIVNVPRSASNATGTSSFLQRSFSKISTSSRHASSSKGALASTPSSSSLARSAATSTTNPIRRFLEKPWKASPTDDCGPVCGSVESRGISFNASPNSLDSPPVPQSSNGSSAQVEEARPRTLSKDYGKLGKTLGEGAGGHVKIVRSNKDSNIYAVKEFRARHANESVREYQKKVGGEYCLGLTLKHPNIVETLDIIYETDRVYQIMSYCEYDLFAIVMSGKMTRTEIFCDFRQIMNGVRYLHESGIAHRDLKLDNCVINDQGIVKIIDFGSAVVFRYCQSEKVYDAHGVVGSDPYLAPEAASRARYDPCATDIWSAAVCLCCMLMRKFPWRAPRLSDTSFKAFVATENGQRTGLDKTLAALPAEVRPIVAGMFDLDPVERFTIEQCWEDPWMIGSPFCSPLRETDEGMDHQHTSVPFEDAHIAMLENKNRRARKGEKMW